MFWKSTCGFYHLGGKTCLLSYNFPIFRRLPFSWRLVYVIRRYWLYGRDKYFENELLNISKIFGFLAFLSQGWFDHADSAKFMITIITKMHKLSFYKCLSFQFISPFFKHAQHGIMNITFNKLLIHKELQKEKLEL